MEESGIKYAHYLRVSTQEQGIDAQRTRHHGALLLHEREHLVGLKLGMGLEYQEIE